MDLLAGDQTALLASSPRRHDGRARTGPVSRANACGPDLGDLVVVLLAGTLERLRDGLAAEGCAHAADFVGDLAEAADDYVAQRARRRSRASSSSRLPARPSGQENKDGG
jgi:hypothetical protein